MRKNSVMGLLMVVVLGLMVIPQMPQAEACGDCEMALYELMEGKHNEAGTSYKKGDVLESEHDLAVKFPKRFRLQETHQRDVSDIVATAKSKTKAKAKAKAGKKGKKAKAGKSAVTNALGTDVSSSFKKLQDGFVVYLRGDHYHAYAEGESKPINPVGLKKRSEIVKRITAFLDE